MKEKIENIRIIAQQIKTMIDGALKIMEKYHDIAKDIIHKYESYNNTLKNFQILRTIHHLVKSNQKVMNDLDILLEGGDDNDDWKSKSSKLIDIYKNDRSFYENGNLSNRSYGESDHEEGEVEDEKEDESTERSFIPIVTKEQKEKDKKKER